MSFPPVLLVFALVACTILERINAEDDWYYAEGCHGMKTEAECTGLDYDSCLWCVTTAKCAFFYPCTNTSQPTCPPDSSYVLSEYAETCNEWHQNQAGFLLGLESVPVCFFICYWISLCRNAPDNCGKKVCLMVTILYTLYIGACWTLFFFPSEWAALDIMAAIPLALFVFCAVVGVCCLWPIWVCCSSAAAQRAGGFSDHCCPCGFENKHSYRMIA